MKYLFALTFVAVLLTGCVEEYKEEKVQAVVVEKDYDPPKTTYRTVKENGVNVKKEKKHPAEYDVTIEYKGITEEFDSRSLYDSVAEGQKINVIYKKGYDKDGKLVAEHLELIR